MKTYLMDLGFDIWKSFVTIYTTIKNPPTCATRKKPNENNSKDMNSILCGLSESNFVKVIYRGSEK